MKKFPKIWHVGVEQVANILDGPVEITEKIDGSQFSFGWFRLSPGVFQYGMRSKNATIEQLAPNDMFRKAHDFAIEQAEFVPQGHVIYGEYLRKEKHNVLKYDRVPHSNFAIFGVYNYMENTWLNHADCQNMAYELGCEVVPLLHEGPLDELSMGYLNTLLDRDSILGGCKIEGIVVKNLNKACEWRGLIYDITCAKYVSEAFKEVHASDWVKENTNKGKLTELVEKYRSEARWNKAIQARREAGELQGQPQDIGPLVKAIHADIFEEEKENIMKGLFSIFKSDFTRKSTAGFPEWYKQQLVEGLDLGGGDAVASDIDITVQEEVDTKDEVVEMTDPESTPSVL